MKKIAIVSLLTIGFLSAFTLEIQKNRDVLQENRVLLNLKVKDSNSSYSYLWRERNRTLGKYNPLKTFFSNGEHNITVEVISANGVKKSASVLLKAWKYKTVTIKWIPWDDSVTIANEYLEIIDYRDALKKESEFVTKKYDKQGNLILKIVEILITEDSAKQTLYIYHNDIEGNCIKEDKFEYITPYKVTLDNENKIIKRDRAVDFNESGRTHFVTHYKYDEEGNKIWEKLEAINKGENIIRVAIHGATAISYIYNLNRDVVKEIAPNACRGTKGRTFYYRYHNEK